MPVIAQTPKWKQEVDRALANDRMVDAEEAKAIKKKARGAAARQNLDAFVTSSPQVFTPEARALLMGAGAVPGGWAPGALSRLELVSFPREKLSAVGETQALGFDLPADAVGFSIIARGAMADSFLISHVDPPGPKNLVETNPPGVAVDHAFNPYDAGQLLSPNRAMISGMKGQAELLVPNNPAVSLKAGRHTFKVKGYTAGATPEDPMGPATGQVDATVVIKRAAGVPTRGRLPVKLFFSGANGYSALSVTQSPLFARALDLVKKTFADVGITLAIEPGGVDLPRGYTRPADGKEIVTMATQGASGEALGIYMVDTILGQASIVGLSTGIPGPAPGQGPGAVLLSTSLAPSNFPVVDTGAAAFAQALAHEIGHYLGLFHTVENFLGVNDQLSDTPTSRDNLMFPNGGSMKLTPQQATVMLRHPSVVVTAVKQDVNG